jgi:hypothetical protein
MKQDAPGLANHKSSESTPDIRLTHSISKFPDCVLEFASVPVGVYDHYNQLSSYNRRAIVPKAIRPISGAQVVYQLL